MTSVLQRSPLARAVGSGVFLLALMIGGTHDAAADEVWLLNGDQLTGTTQILEGGVLTFKTAYADTVKVAWRDVAGLQTQRELRVTVRGAGAHIARIAPGSEGQLRLQTNAGTSLDVPLNDVTSIVPSLSGLITTGRAETGLLMTSGSTDFDSLHLNAEITWRTPLRRFSTDIAINRAKDHGLETAHNITWTFRDAEFLTDRIYLNANIIFTNDRFRDLALRTAPGLGLGFQVFQYGVTTLSFDGGLGYVKENYNLRPDTQYWAARENVKFEHWLVSQRLQLFHQHDGYYGLTGDDNLFVRTRSGLRLSLMGGLIMTDELGLDYDRRPVAGRKNLDRTFAITFGYQKS